MEESIFTKIITGKVPSSKVYEDDRTLVFVDIKPIQFGQVVVVPKQQVSTVWDLSRDDYLALMETVQRVGQRMRSVFANKQYTGVIIEGLEIKNHAHVKVFPFDTAEEYHRNPNSDPLLTHEVMDRVAQQLRFDD
ncbi:HIT family protein [Candidatus Saccharibacteria bacterium]|nr:HIT family protein [Candidatus Saccharibacteria bacterium]